MEHNDPKALTPEELARENAAELPDREALSVINPTSAFGGATLPSPGPGPVPMDHTVPSGPMPPDSGVTTGGLMGSGGPTPR